MRFHTNLPVTNIEQTIAFYRILFDCEPTKVKADYAKFLPEQMNLNLSFHVNPGGAEKLSSLHIGIEQSDAAALERAHTRLEEAGLISTKRDTSVCCYASQDKFWVTDPDGYEWELYHLLEDTSRKMSDKSGCCAAACDSEGAASGTGCC